MNSPNTEDVFPQDRIETERLVLREFTESDVPDVTATASDPLSARWTRVPEPYTEEHARAWVGELTRTQRESGDGIAWAVTAGGRYAGSVDLKKTDWPNRVTEIGYLAAPWARGRGYIPEAVRAVAEWALQKQGFSRVHLHAEVGNAASLRVAEKAGFVREGVLRNAWLGKGGRADLEVWSLIPEDLV